MRSSRGLGNQDRSERRWCFHLGGLEHSVGEPERIRGYVFGAEDGEMRVVELHDEWVVHPLDALAGGVDLLVGRLMLLALHDGVLPVGRFDVELADVIARREFIELCHHIAW